jgi:hypothetical protein
MFKEVDMTRLRMISRTSWLWLDGAAVLIAAAFLACGGPVPIASGSSSPLGGGGANGTNTNLGLNTNPSTNTNIATDTGVDVNAPDAAVCGNTTAPLNKQPADLLLVLDKTGSLSRAMDSACDCTGGGRGGNNNPCTGTCQERWATLVSGLNAVLSDPNTATDLNWGLEIFNSDNACGVDPPEVDVAPNSAAAVKQYIAGIKTGGRTPTRVAINTAVTYLKGLTDPNPKYILLATDGEPNCLSGGGGGGQDTDIWGTQDAIGQAFAAGFKVYVLGVGPETTNLNQLADAGGTWNYYSATTPEMLTASLATIVGSVVSCSFGLGTAPPVPSNVAVQFNQDPNPSIKVPHDTSHTNGWDYTTPADTTIQLYGSWCDDVTSGKYANAQILMGCPGGAPVQQ